MGYAKGIKWNEKLIEDEIIKVANTLGIDYMPSKTEIVSVWGNDALTNKIAKTGGFNYWAEKLELNIKNSDTKLGQQYEEKAIKIIKSKGFQVKRMTTKYPFDLLVNDKISIDVKVARPSDTCGARSHIFTTAKKYATCDLYMIFALDEVGEVERMFIIPGNDLKVVTMSIGSKSKYDKYINRWDYLDKFNRFYEHLA